MNVRALVAEFVGTFAFVFVGVGSITAGGGPAGLLGIALAHGFMIAVMASAVGAISGGHFNPAVSFGAWIGRRISTVNLIAYWIAQIAGAFAGAWLLHYCLPASLGGTPALGSNVDFTKGFILEALGTFFLVFVVYGTAIDHRAPKMGALFIGLVIVGCILCFGPATGASINPARYLGPALAESDMTNALLYIFAPLIGAGVAGLLYNYFLAEKEPDMPVSTLAP